MNTIMKTGALIGFAALATASAVHAQHPQPATTGRQAPGASVPVERRAPQGFSVVLVLGDMQAGSSQDTVPAAARKALADMKDFLPYKGYRLLDAQWTLCCGRGGRSPVVSRLRGAEERDYELALESDVDSRANTVAVRFLLRESADHEGAVAAVNSPVTAELEREVVRAEDQLQTALKTAVQRTEVGTAGPPEQDRTVVQHRNRLADLRTKLAEAARQHRITPRAQAGPSRSVIIDTSFTMEVGETVVVGTSRLKGEKALIALLTAVPATKPAR